MRQHFRGFGARAEPEGPLGVPYSSMDALVYDLASRDFVALYGHSPRKPDGSADIRNYAEATAWDDMVRGTRDMLHAQPEVILAAARPRSHLLLLVGAAVALAALSG